MSPFAKSPEYWLTGHLRRLAQQDEIVKIQAVCRGFLVRRRQEKERNARAVLHDVLSRLQYPTHTHSLQEMLMKMGFDTWAYNLPSAADALDSETAANQRRDAIWNASICLRLTGKSHLIADLQWADYHERGRALQAAADFHNRTETMWSRFKKHIWG